jgi:ubiquinone/menaquinone biosynthesis C-methylase UbiE
LGGEVTIDLDEYRQQSHASWEEMASGWEKRREWVMRITAPVNDWVADRLAPEPGQTILELACGTGDLGFMLAERVGDQGRVISTDFAGHMVEVAERNAEGRGLGNVEHRVMDAERMDLEDDSVDGVACRWGYMLIADPAAALSETRRVLGDGGRLSFAVWDAPDRNPWAAIPAMTLVQRGHVPPPEPGAPGIFALADPERTRGLVTAAGFDEPQLEQIAFEFRYADDDDFWDALVSLAGPLARVVKALPEDERQATHDAILQNVGEYRNDDGSYTCPAVTWGVLAS